MWAALWNVFRIAGLTSGVYFIEEKLRFWFGGADSENDNNANPLRPYLFLVAAAGVVFVIYKLMGKKIIIK